MANGKHIVEAGIGLLAGGVYMRTYWTILLFCLAAYMMPGCSSTRGGGAGAAGADGSTSSADSSATSGWPTSGTSATAGSSGSTGDSSPSSSTGTDETSSGGAQTGESGGMSGTSGTSSPSSSTGTGETSSGDAQTGQAGSATGTGTSGSAPSSGSAYDRSGWGGTGTADTPAPPAAKDDFTFPWPPPEASAAIEIPLRGAMETWRRQHYFPPRPANAPVFLNPEKLAAFFTADSPLLTHADHALRYILSSAGYVETSYHQIPDGFALVTHLERIEADGRPKEPGRWDVDASDTGPFSLAAYLRALFTAPAGHYRIRVFAVTPAPLKQSGGSVSSATAQGWLRHGRSYLPDSVGNRVFGWDYHCTVLIYEFERDSANSTAALKYPGLSAMSHLTGAGLAKLLP